MREGQKRTDDSRDTPEAAVQYSAVALSHSQSLLVLGQPSVTDSRGGLCLLLPAGASGSKINGVQYEEHSHLPVRGMQPESKRDWAFTSVGRVYCTVHVTVDWDDRSRVNECPLLSATRSTPNICLFDLIILTEVNVGQST